MKYIIYILCVLMSPLAIAHSDHSENVELVKHGAGIGECSMAMDMGDFFLKSNMPDAKPFLSAYFARVANIYNMTVDEYFVECQDSISAYQKYIRTVVK